MPRPGYEPEEDSAPLSGREALLARFDPELRAELERRLADGNLGEEHLAQVYRLISAAPEERDVDVVVEMLDEIERMSGEEFRGWVDERLLQLRDR